MYLGAGQALAPFLSSRKSGWVNLVGAHWLESNEELSHAVIQLHQVVLAIPLDNDLPVINGSNALQMRAVEMHLTDGRRMAARLHLGERQRLADYLHAIGQFVPCTDASFPEDQWPIGDAVINTTAIRLVNDLAGAMEGDLGEEEELPGLPTPRQTGRFSAMSPQMLDAVPERRQTTSIPAIPFAVATSQPYRQALSETAAQVGNHWLSKLAARFGLRPADPRLVREATTEGIWNALAETNAVSDATLAMNVAAALRLPLAPLAEADPAALALLPSRVARRHNILPISVTARGLRIATSDPADVEAEQAISALLKTPVVWEFAAPRAIREALAVRYPPERASQMFATGTRRP